MDTNHPISQWLGNGASAVAIIGGFLGWAPAIGALVAAAWYSIQIYESATVQRWVANRRIRKIARMKARVIMLEAQARDPLPGGKTSFDDPGL
jgi:hypothetical protein